MQGEQSSAGAGLDLAEDDPFSTEVKVSLPGAQAEPSKDGDKGEQPQQKTEDQGDGTDNQLFAGDEDQGDDGAGGGRVKDNLRASRRNAKRLRRALDGKSQIISSLQQQVSSLSGTVTALAKSQINGQLASTRAEVNRLVAQRQEARRADDAEAESAAEEAITRMRAEVLKLEDATRELDGYRAPQGRNAMLVDWLDTNGDWYQKPGFEKETATAVRISEDLARNGIGQFDPRHYSMMNDGLQKQFPRLAEEGDALDDAAPAGKPAGARRDQPMRGVTPGGRPSGGGGGGAKGPMVPRALVETWRAAGFDVNDNAVQKKMHERYQETQAKLKLRA